MAEWGVKGLGKSCEQCRSLLDPSGFEKGARVKVVLDCENCPVSKARPLPENENIIILYEALPRNYDGITGRRIVTASDIKFILELYEVPRELWSEYYHKLLFFHEQVLLAVSREEERKTKIKKQMTWKRIEPSSGVGGEKMAKKRG